MTVLSWFIYNLNAIPTGIPTEVICFIFDGPGEIYSQIHMKIQRVRNNQYTFE